MSEVDKIFVSISTLEKTGKKKDKMELSLVANEDTYFAFKFYFSSNFNRARHPSIQHS